MTKTYSELRQEAYFKAAALMYDVASAVLNDCTEPGEFTGATYEWAKNLAAETAAKAQALKEQALEECAVPRAPRGYNAAQSRYTDAVMRHLRLRDEYTKAAGVLDGGPRRISIDGRIRDLFFHQEIDSKGGHWATTGENSDRGYSLYGNGAAYRDVWKNGERITRTFLGYWREVD